MKITNIIAVIRDQTPVTALVGNLPDLLDPQSHIAPHSGKPRITYPTREDAGRALRQLGSRNPHKVHRPYKCLHCDGFHIGTFAR